MLKNDDLGPFFKTMSDFQIKHAQVSTNRELVDRLRRIFEAKSQRLEGVEIWLARDLQRLLDYSEWRNFTNVINKAKEACKVAGAEVEDHFVDVNKVIEKGKGARESIADIALTRYACYLIAQNGDPAKRPVAFAQTYFALQTRKQEVLEERLAERECLEARNKLTQTEKELSGVIYERGVDTRGFARVRSKGDSALFGGVATHEMKDRLNAPRSRALADFLPTITIKAKDLAAEMTNFTVKDRDLKGEARISREHMASNKNVRGALTQSGIYPENLPPEEDIKKLERRLKSEEKRLPKASDRIPKRS